MPETTDSSFIHIQLFRSPICTPEKHKVIVRSLGLRKVNQVVQKPDTPGFRGMVKKIPHLLKLVDVPAERSAGVQQPLIVKDYGNESQ